MRIFISKIQQYSTCIVMDGATYRIEFTAKGRPYLYGYYVCHNDKLADALKKHPKYGEIFEAQEEQKQVESKKEYKAVYEDVTRTQAANKILVETYGVDKDKLKSKDDALRIADELLVSFPNLK